MEKVIRIIYTKDGLDFVWHGGAYIEIFEAGESVPFDAMNVWNYETDKPNIEPTMEALANFVDARIEELVAESANA